MRYLERRGLLDSDVANTDPLNNEAPVLASCYATSITGRQALGRRKGAKLERIGSDPDAMWVDSRGPLQVALEGFDLHAARLSMLEDGRVALELKTRGTTEAPTYSTSPLGQGSVVELWFSHRGRGFRGDSWSFHRRHITPIPYFSRNIR